MLAYAIYLLVLHNIPSTPSPHKHTHNHDNIADDVTEQQQYHSECSGHVRGSAQQQQKQIGGTQQNHLLPLLAPQILHSRSLDLMVLYVG